MNTAVSLFFLLRYLLLLKWSLYPFLIYIFECVLYRSSALSPGDILMWLIRRERGDGESWIFTAKYGVQGPGEAYSLGRSPDYGQILLLGSDWESHHAHHRPHEIFSHADKPRSALSLLVRNRRTKRAPSCTNCRFLFVFLAFS